MYSFFLLIYNCIYIHICMERECVCIHVGGICTSLSVCVYLLIIHKLELHSQTEVPDLPRSFRIILNASNISSCLFLCFSSFYPINLFCPLQSSFHPSHHLSNLVVLNQGQICPLWTFGNVEGIFGFYSQGGSATDI